MESLINVSSLESHKNPFSNFRGGFDEDHVQETTRFYVITKQLTEGVSKNSKRLHKHGFKLSKLNVQKEVQKHLFNIAKNQINLLATDENLEPMPYQVLDERGEGEVHEYQLLPEEPFYDLTYNQLQNTSELDIIQSLSEIKEKVHAYVVKIEIYQTPIFLMAKLQSNRIILTERKPGFFRFNTKEARLEPCSEESLV
jgi:hypothetical protein